jgi:hypothetical protein
VGPAVLWFLWTFGGVLALLLLVGIRQWFVGGIEWRLDAILVALRTPRPPTP